MEIINNHYFAKNLMNKRSESYSCSTLCLSSNNFNCSYKNSQPCKTLAIRFQWNWNRQY